MELNIHWTDASLIQLEQIYTFLKELESVSFAQKTIQNIVDKTIYLKKNPYIGPKEPLLSKNKKDYRYLVEGNYKIIYRVEHTDVFINSIFDCRQNPKKLKP